jgi:hypothetical protein
MKKKIFVFFWLPYAAKYTHQTFLTAFYIALNRFPKDQCIHIGMNALFAPPPSELPASWLESFGCQLPSARELSELNKRTIDPSIFHELQRELVSNNLVYKNLLTKPHDGLKNALNVILDEILSEFEVEAMLAWCNSPSLTEIANSRGLPIIHQEMGPLREPFYQHTAYFDFSGVNGNTEADTRLKKLNATGKIQNIELFTRKQILSILCNETYLCESVEDYDKYPEYEFGIPLQVEDDSNILAFNNGFTNSDLIAFVKSNSNSILVRKHPAGHADYACEHVDTSSPISFIKKCKTVVTINSSMGLEAYLQGRKVWILGDSPFKFLSSFGASVSDDKAASIALNFFIFGYIIPLQCLYSIDYYRWRLSAPKESDIFKFHLNIYLAQQGHLIEFTNIPLNLGNLIFEASLRSIKNRTETAIQLESKARINAETRCNQANEKNFHLGTEIEHAHAHFAQLKTELDCANAHIDQLDKELKHANARITQSDSELNHLSKQLRVMHQDEIYSGIKSLQTNQTLREVYMSRSWRITRPLRMIMLSIKYIIRQSKRICKPLLIFGIRQILASQRLSSIVKLFLVRSPKLGQHLRLFSQRANLIPTSGNNFSLQEAKKNSNHLVLTPLSPRVKDIYETLKQAIEKRQSN